MKLTEQNKALRYEDIKEQTLLCTKVFDLVELNINNKQDVNLCIYDLPGLDDSKTSDIYLQYVTENFHKFDIIIFMLDVHDALNRTNDIKILGTILNGMCNNDTELTAPLNKRYETDKLPNGEPEPSDEEMKEISDQAKI